MSNKTIHPPDINYQAQIKYGNVQSGKRVKRKKTGQVFHRSSGSMSQLIFVHNERPGPILRVISVQDNIIEIDDIDAFPDTPVLDIKP